MYMLLPSRVTPVRRHFDCLTRLPGGYLGVGGTVPVGLMLAAGVWWGTAAGVLAADAIRIALALILGGAGVVSLANAGRRAALSWPWVVVLSAALGSGLVGLIHLALIGCRLVLGALA
ncbi:hypothetical protein PTR01_20840 [Serratia bockelmannii]|uniref:hypothetical protein n=1 Tax=Serratia bockelmannii TaxID=2703793 RepID=UPI00313BD746